MATLTESAYYARKVINILIVGLIVFTSLRAAYLYIEQNFNPPPEPNKPTIAFGKLPYPNMKTDLTVSAVKITYTIETVNNSLPPIPESLPVFYIPQAERRFQTSEIMANTARNLGFTTKPTLVSEGNWRFVDPVNSLRTLEYQEIPGSFFLRYDFASDQNLFREGSVRGDDVNTAMTFLTSTLQYSAFPTTEILRGRQIVSYLKFEKNSLVPTDSANSADATRVTFNREDIAAAFAIGQKPINYPVISPDPKKGNVYVDVSPSQHPKKKILTARYAFLPRHPTPATYPLITTAAAFSYLQAGEGAIVSLPKNFTGNVAIREASFAYLDPDPPQPFLQPIMVFSDKRGFLAYLPIISREWLVKPEPEAPAK